MLEVRLRHAQSKQLNERLLAEQKSSERLVKEVPKAIKEHFQEVPRTADAETGLITESHAEVMVLFADIMEFTRYSEGASAEVLTGGRSLQAQAQHRADRFHPIGDQAEAEVRLVALNARARVTPTTGSHHTT